jgi:hypothetical protein
VEAYLITLSTPIKPGAVHRLSLSTEFEVRLAEAAAVLHAFETSYQRGKELARGDRDARSLSLGKVIGSALIRAFEHTEVRPLTGVITSLIIASASYGYFQHVSSRTTAEDSLRRIVSALYSSTPEDTLHFIEGLEGVGDSDLLLILDREGYTRRKIEMNSLSLGYVFEVLAKEDTGFYANYRFLNNILDVTSQIKGSPNLLKGVLSAYMNLLSKKLGGPSLPSTLSLRQLKELDDRLSSDRGTYNRLLGVIALGVALVLFEEPPNLPRPK